MLSWAITFLIIAIVAAVLGFGGIAGAATGIAKILFIVFLVLFVASFFFWTWSRLKMSRKLCKALAAALLLGGSAAAMAANDGQVRVDQVLGSDPEYRETWQDAIKGEERLPDWVINLTGSAQEQMSAVTEDGDKYLVGPLCETQDNCTYKRLIVAFSWDKDDAYGMLVEVPEGLPSDKSPTRHAQYRWLGEPDDGMKAMLQEQLKRDPKWY